MLHYHLKGETANKTCISSISARNPLYSSLPRSIFIQLTHFCSRLKWVMGWRNLRKSAPALLNLFLFLFNRGDPCPACPMESVFYVFYSIGVKFPTDRDYFTGVRIPSHTLIIAMPIKSKRNPFTFPQRPGTNA
jgi:hypothetical protein